MRRLTASCLVAAAWMSVVACPGSCPTLPCPEPFPIVVNVFSADGAPLTGATVQASGVVNTSPIHCTLTSSQNQCRVPGGPGDYDLKISAPGFQTATQSVTVAAITSKTGGCGCVGAVQTTINVTLTPEVAPAPGFALR